MAATASLIPEIDAIARATPQRRAETLQRMTTLFIEGAWRLSEEQVALFDDVLGRLVIEIESMALANLAERLAPVSNAPAGLVRSLARHQSIAVAGPLLRESKRLDEADLIDIARNLDQPHLVAISARNGVAESVTDVLIRRGDHEVVRTVVNNSAARFSEPALPPSFSAPAMTISWRCRCAGVPTSRRRCSASWLAKRPRWCRSGCSRPRVLSGRRRYGAC